MYDFTNWHDEVKIVKDEFMVGKWCSPWTSIPLDFGPSFLSVDKIVGGSKKVLPQIYFKTNLTDTCLISMFRMIY